MCPTGNTIKVLSLSDGCEKINIVDQSNPDDSLVDFVNDSSNNRNKLFAAYRSGLIKEWDWDESSFTVKKVWKSFHTGPITSMAMIIINRCEADRDSSAISSLIATGGSDSTIKIWRSWGTAKGDLTYKLKECQGIISLLSFHSPHPDYTAWRTDELIYLIAAGELDNIVNVYTLNPYHSTAMGESCKIIARLEGHSSKVVGAFIVDQNRVLTGSRDMIAIVWSLDKSIALRKIPLFEAIETILLMPCDSLFKPCEDTVLKQTQLFVTAGPKGIVRGWDLNTGNCVFTQKNSILASNNEKDDSQLIVQLVLHPNKEQLLVSSYEKNILFYSLKDFKLEKQLIGHIDQIYDIKFLGHNEEHLVVASNSPYLKIIELSTLNCSVVKGHSQTVLAIQVFPSNPDQFVSSSKDNDIRVWKFLPSSVNAICLYIASGHSMSVTCLAVPSKSEKYLYSASEDTTFKVWKIPKRRTQEDYSETIETLSTLETIKAHDKEINNIVFSPNDKFICSCSQDKTAKLWSVDGNISLIAVLKGHKRGVWSAAFSPIDLIVATSSVDTTIKIWSLSDFSCVKTLQGHESSVLNMNFINQGTQLISSASDGNVKLWTVKNSECTYTLDAHLDKIWAMTMNKDESLLVTGSDDSKLIVWKDDTEERMQEAADKREQFVLNEQKLSNLIKAQKWTKALKLAIKLDQPFRALNIIKEIFITEQANRINVLEESLKGLREDQLNNLIEYSLKWNTNAKNSEVAQSVFFVLINIHGPDKILKMPNSKQFIEGWLSYTRRHVDRLNRLKEQASIVNFLYTHMKLD